MDQVIEKARTNESIAANWPEVRTLKLDLQQAKLICRFSKELADLGGPQAPGTRTKAAGFATEIKQTFGATEAEILRTYGEGRLSTLIIEGMLPISENYPPDALPSLREIDERKDIIQLGARNQILLKLVDNLAFAYDIDNDAKIIRVVANIKGGGKSPLRSESQNPELSSHSGLALGPHTEAPYWCAGRSHSGHSPSPSSLILSALWNPQHEPTSVIPLPSILKSLGIDRCLALATPWFQFTRSDSFVEGMGEDGSQISILSFDENGGFSARFNTYRFSVMQEAPISVKKAFDAFKEEIGACTPFQHSLSQHSAIIINNTRALHCRDILQDNRRVLVRLFGYSRYAEPIAYSQDPLLVHG
ncbi:MAG: hypothetical protein QM569_00795 [Acidovorax sp.]|uniref:hypothetical protein n=1 Tax=Acidovorax sp. TaxID=1872122 RepID=UPI0039E4B889